MTASSDLGARAASSFPAAGVVGSGAAPLHLRAPLRRHQQVLQREAALLVRLVAPLQRADEVHREHAQLAVHLLLEPDELGADDADQLLGAAAAAAHHLAHARRAAAAARAELVREALHVGRPLVARRIARNRGESISRAPPASTTAGRPRAPPPFCIACVHRHVCTWPPPPPIIYTVYICLGTSMIATCAQVNKFLTRQHLFYMLQTNP